MGCEAQIANSISHACSSALNTYATANGIAGQQATLEGYLQWVLKGADVDLDYESVNEIAAALSTSGVQDAIREFLGTTASRALIENLQACEESLLEIAKSIDSLLPSTATPKQVTLATLLSRNGAHQGVSVWKGVKLALSRTELDTAIQKIDSATSLLDKLQSTRTAIGQLESNEPSKRSKKLVKRLIKTSVCAERLYHGLLASWQPPCHTEHKVHLYLEDRVLDQGTTKDSQVSSPLFSTTRTRNFRADTFRSKRWPPALPDPLSYYARQQP